MREVIVRASAQARDLLSKELSAFAGLLFKSGSGRLIMEDDVEADLQKVMAQLVRSAFAAT